ncbi:MAG TPA: RluA family pseudouridine synthase [bacterium]|nr:RluA family pseudouridine synthase [bacterium]
MSHPRPEPEPILLTSRIPPDADGTRLLDYLCARFRYHDRSAWQRELDAARLTLDDRTASADDELRRGQRLRYAKLHREPPVADGYRVLHEDDVLLVVDKPAHLPMHADGPFLRNTLIHMLRRRFGDDLQLVHRLDRETSGAVVVARDKRAQAAIQRQFLDGGLRKVYYAVVHGRLERTLCCEQAIGHHPRSAVRLRRSAASDAIRPKAASTRIEPLRVAAHHTLVRCVPRTGRTHQIRVHLEHAGHPVVGDKLYGRDDDHYLAFVARMKAGDSVFAAPAGEPDRQLLHAGELSFRHPGTGAEFVASAPMPAEFEDWLSP